MFGIDCKDRVAFGCQDGALALVAEVEVNPLIAVFQHFRMRGDIAFKGLAVDLGIMRKKCVRLINLMIGYLLDGAQVDRVPVCLRVLLLFVGNIADCHDLINDFTRDKPGCKPLMGHGAHSSLNIDVAPAGNKAVVRIE